MAENEAKVVTMARLTSINIKGFRPFQDFTAQLGPLEVIVGANGAGKSALFEFLKFLHDSTQREIPLGIIEGYVGQQIFHILGPDRFTWGLELDTNQGYPLIYEGQLDGPIGRTRISLERIYAYVGQEQQRINYMEVIDQNGLMREHPLKLTIQLSRRNQLALSIANNPEFSTLYNLREFISSWAFYSSTNLATSTIRRPAPTDQNPILREDAGNLSAVLFFLMTEHRRAFDEIQSLLRQIVPAFTGLTVKARGGPGEIMAFWREGDQELTLADVSDGILRLLCWMVLCVTPNPPSLICIDEPDQGVHPRTLPILAGLFRRASQRTQILLATHNSYFLTQFDFGEIAVMRKKDRNIEFLKPAHSQVLIDMLADFGSQEVEQLHRSDELELLP